MGYLYRTSRRRPARAKWVVVFVVAIAALLAFCGHPGRHSAEPQAARPCQAAQLRASLAGDSGYASEEEATVGLTNESPEVCVLEGYPLLSVSTLAHRPFPFSVNDYHGDAEGPGVWPVPRAIVLRRHMGAYFLITGWTSKAAQRTPPLTAWATFMPRSTSPASTAP